MSDDTSSIFQPGLLSGRTALITGGATGIGFATAKLMGQLGAQVIIGSRDADKLQAAVAQLRALAVNAHGHVVNVRDEAAIDKLFAELTAASRLPDILVNNAGGQFASPALDISPNGFRAVVDLNLTGSWLMSVAFARHFRAAQNKTGAIVSIVLAQQSGIPGMVHAAAARSGVANMMKTLAYEWGGLGLTVNALAPGTVDTEALIRYDRAGLEATAARLPVPRMASAEEVAQAVVYLVSPAARFITGITLQIDGGEHLLGAQAQSAAG